MYRFRKVPRRAANNLTTQSHSNYVMASLLNLMPSVTTLNGFKVRTQHRSKGNSLNQTNGHLDIEYT